METCHKCEASVGNCTCPPPSQIPLGHCLDEAKNIINGERQDQYGNPEDSFALVAKYWEAYLNASEYTDEDNLKPKDLNVDIELDAKDIAHMMILFKLARCSGQQEKRDNYVDIAGYTAIVADRLIGDK